MRAVAQDEMPRSITKRCTRQSEWKCPWTRDLVRKNVAVTRWPVWVRGLAGESGIYLIRDRETKEMLYVGRGRIDLKGALLRHFHQWGYDRRGVHRRVLFDREAVEVKVYLVPVPWVVVTEADLIALHRPRENARPEESSRTLEEVPF
jgi:hypothetical protein